MAEKVKFKIVKENFQDFINKLKDLTTIDDAIKIRIKNENIFLYSTLGRSVILAFKSYSIETKKYLDSKPIDNPIDIILPNCKKLVKNLEFLQEKERINLNISYEVSPDDEDIMISRGIQFTGGRLRVNWISGERYEVRDIEESILKQRLDLKNRNWSFIISNTDFMNIKKLSNINSEKIITIDVNSSGKVIFSEASAWDLQVSETEKKSTSFIFNKRFFKCIDQDQEDIEFNLFDNFILIKQENSDLMLSYEQDFEEEDV